MARVTVEDCLDNEDNRFALVILASNRTRQIMKGAKLQIDPHRYKNKPAVLALREIAAGSCSAGIATGGKPMGHDAGGMRGLNDYTGWFAGDAAMGGQYFGYDGPYPPPHDLRTHRYFFRLFALDVERIDLPPAFTAGDVFRAIRGHVLAEASTHGTYSLNG